MKTTTNILSKTRLSRLRAQGYIYESDETLSGMAFGIRFAYRSCVAILLTAMITKSTAIFSVMLVIAFLGVVLPKHPFDYVYNFALSKWMNKPLLPARSAQLKFACTIATIWLASIVWLMNAGMTTGAMILAGMLAATAALPSTIDLCVPSLLFNALFKRTGSGTQIKAA